MDNTHSYAINWKNAAPTPRTSRSRRLLRNIVLTTLATIERPTQNNFLRALYGHYVFDDQRERFEEVIIELKKIGTFVSADTCLEMLLGKREIDGKYFHLSFDDGFRNIFTNAVPILKRHQVPATFFVPTQVIEADWETTKEYCLNTTLYSGVIEMVHWEDLKEMMALGFEIGSHTKTHARFSAISGDTAQLEDEIIGSKHDLEDRLGQECKYIAWPYGERRDADALSLQMTQQAGYHACFSAIRGVINPKTSNRFSIPRHFFEVEMPLSHIKGFARGMWESKQ